MQISGFFLSISTRIKPLKTRFFPTFKNPETRVIIFISVAVRLLRAENFNSIVMEGTSLRL
uniref:Uncharacterized protein n=1 Tax=Anguilla anguilla TaxID=7936 RepID=A0A0E9QP43_ANGAN